MYVVGTAGHVDHGKSALVQALTGIDPDRLREEKERGLTTDLGFAWLTLPSGREISIVDVPGHERFIKNMLAGAGGVDLALLVVAADEGPMPQTREHLAILELLDVPAAIVAITKVDLVEPEYVDLVAEEVAEALRSSRFAGVPVCGVSAVSGEGLDTLVAALDDALAGRPQKRDIGRPRLPIDRAFRIQGFGVVVTGTLIDGSLQVGDEVELQPGRVRARIRGLQRHKTRVNRLLPGTRAAVNLSGVRLEDVRRGMVLGHPGTITVARAVDVRLEATALRSHPLRHNAGVTFLSATAESEARLRLLDRDELEPRGQAWAQLVLETPVALAVGDHCVIRTANETAAGGRIVALNPGRHRRGDDRVLERLRLALEGTPEERLGEILLARGPCPAGEVRNLLGVSEEEAEGAVESLTAADELLRRGGLLVSRGWLQAATRRLLAAIEDYLRDRPLRTAAPREHIRAALQMDQGAFDLLVAEVAGDGQLEERGAGLSLAGYRVRLTREQEEEVEAYLEALRAGAYNPPTDAHPEPELLAYLVETGRVEDTGAGVVFARETFEEMKRKTLEYIAAHGSITLAEARDLFGTSRKYAQAFLEHLDELRLTRRTGDARVARAPRAGR